ncbi:MAG: hypothetical protein RI841_11115 [Halomonas sp.]|uniref:hypothetical protein n=1 Tax=Halomonas sp. TaxID=1486246 RepID=UPI002870568E|nr:hypothetical protein [Halomonas sp.]MDR9440024.1 hypothetical protein [Halomonas sp.]
MKISISKYGKRSVPVVNSDFFRLHRMLYFIAAILTFFAFSIPAYPDSQETNPDNAMTAFMVGGALGEAYMTAQYEGGIPATLKMGVLKNRLINRGPSCLESLVGEIDSVIQKLRVARTNQQAMNIVSDFRHEASNRAWNNCGCKICRYCPEPVETKMLYNVWTPPYGPQALCLTPDEAAARKAEGENVVSLGKSCK